MAINHAAQTQQALDTTLMQLTCALNLVQARLDSLEKQVQIPARMTPCIVERQNMEYACQQVILKAQKERDEIQAKALQAEQSHFEALKSNQSLASGSEVLAKKLENRDAEVAKLKLDLQSKDEQYKLLKTAADPFFKRAEAIQAEKRQRERGAQLQRSQLLHFSATMDDGYRIKRPSSQDHSHRN